MKKLGIALGIALLMGLLPAAAFADFQIGGTALYWDQTEEQLTRWSWNVKMGLDITLGDIAIGLSGYYFVSDFSELPSALSEPPKVAVSLLLKLF